MNRSVVRLAVLLAIFTLAAGCRRKAEDADLADEAEKALPPAEQVTKPDDTAPAAPALAGTAGNADYEAWFKKHHLDLNDPKMLDADPDGDGFSNRDEFLANTDPHDANSVPGQHPKIRLKEFTEVRLPLIVESVEGGKARIRRTDVAGRTESVKEGDAIKGLAFTVQRVEQIQDTDKEGHPIDRSIVVLEDGGTKERLTLVKDMPARTANSYAVLTAADGKTVKVKQGDTFQWPGDDTASYKVIDLREDQVVLQQVEDKKMWTVPRATEAK
jgi:hypothetical protein